MRSIVYPIQDRIDQPFASLTHRPENRPDTHLHARSADAPTTLSLARTTYRTGHYVEPWGGGGQMQRLASVSSVRLRRPQSIYVSPYWSKFSAKMTVIGGLVVVQVDTYRISEGVAEMSMAARKPASYHVPLIDGTAQASPVRGFGAHAEYRTDGCTGSTRTSRTWRDEARHASSPAMPRGNVHGPDWGGTKGRAAPGWIGRLLSLASWFPGRDSVAARKPQVSMAEIKRICPLACFAPRLRCI